MVIAVKNILINLLITWQDLGKIIAMYLTFGILWTKTWRWKIHISRSVCIFLHENKLVWRSWKIWKMKAFNYDSWQNLIKKLYLSTLGEISTKIGVKILIIGRKTREKRHLKFTKMATVKIFKNEGFCQFRSVVKKRFENHI